MLEQHFFIFRITEEEHCAQTARSVESITNLTKLSYSPSQPDDWLCYQPLTDWVSMQVVPVTGAICYTALVISFLAIVVTVTRVLILRATACGDKRILAIVILSVHLSVTAWYRIKPRWDRDSGFHCMIQQSF